nr:SCO1664 family protein [Streptomyces sp. AJS327]
MTGPQGPEAARRLSGEAVRAVLRSGTLTVRGQLRGASNAVLYGEVTHEGRTLPCVYKPVAGERPLWDFPDGTLAQREVAAYEVSRVTGWDLIPATVLRDGPYGEGMCQAWVGPPPDGGPEDSGTATPPAAPERAAAEPSGPEAAHTPDDGAGRGAVQNTGETGDAGSEDDPLGQLLALVEGDEPGEGWKAVGHAEVGGGRTALLVHADDPRLRRLAVLDAVINNADRKGGHLLRAPGGWLYAIDHGVTFSADDKLRTLLWGWAGEELTAEATETLRGLAAELAEGAPLALRLAALLTPVEVEAVRKRVATLLGTLRHPLPSGDWPAIPWPPV